MTVALEQLRASVAAMSVSQRAALVAVIESAANDGRDVQVSAFYASLGAIVADAIERAHAHLVVPSIVDVWGPSE